MTFQLSQLENKKRSLRALTLGKHLLRCELTRALVSSIRKLLDERETWCGLRVVVIVVVFLLVAGEV